jgi:hypothetical protein
MADFQLCFRSELLSSNQNGSWRFSSFASDRNFIPATRMVSWQFSSFPVLLKIGTSFQQPE